MGKYNIDIDSIIGPWGYSKHYVKQKLNECKDQEVKVRMNSFGGSLDHGLDMMNQFKEHGKVTVYLCGFNASAATVASLGAKKIMMDKNGFYLVHKVSNWVGEWGQMNADEMDAAIERLEKNKQENQKIDLVMARIYSDKTGKSIDDILDVLTKGTWITADDALEYGFVDELFNYGEKMNFTPEMQEKFNAFGLPKPDFPKAKEKENTSLFNFITETIKKEFDSFRESFKGEFKNSSQDNNQKNMSKTDLTHINEALGLTEILFDKENKVVLSEEQLVKLNGLLEEKKNEKETLLQEKEELTNQVEALKNGDGDSTEEVDTTGKDAPKNTMGKSKELFNEIKDL